MTFEAATVDATQIPYSITLGDMTLYADGFLLEETRPYDLVRMWNGSWYMIPLGQKPCRLQLQCRVSAALRDALTVVLRSALADKTAFAFTLGGTAFSDMKLECYKLQAEHDALFCCAEMVFLGNADTPAVDA